MLARQRQELILDEVRRTGGARVSELVDRLGVSDMTVRRDIEVLAGRGLVTRVHGGATLAGSSVDEPGFVAKSGLHTTAKQAIATAAAQLVEAGASVALSAGTTTHAVASALLGVPRLTVVTNSLRVAEVLHESGRDDLTVVITGGVRTPSDALVGPVAVAALRGLHVDWLLLGVHGMDAEAGFTTPNLVEAETNRALVASARRVAVVADNSKWGVVGLSTIAALDEVDVVVTDTGLEPGARSVLENSCGRLVLAA
ncbi:DeoR/GlpR family DNA-binding transcription regulator [Pseudonocardia sp. TRM90224]|uniref:DeoR/GlpR family DNA-binding transcription regulator n=1 Tax=Pseudonocardia sp. TRM90224 TaxID=2812678 RepID=UPI001E40E84C|nr:DeoR/GlpR family DNA-binding transcription regulator [Pseudonocardia sp. TRM90224]